MYLSEEAHIFKDKEFWKCDVLNRIKRDSTVKIYTTEEILKKNCLADT